MSTVRSCVLLTPLLFASTAVFADSSSNEPPPLGQVIVTATKLDITQAQMTQASEVTISADLSAQAQTSVTDVLREQPGFQAEVAGAPGQFIYPRLRGFSDSTLYVFDGITMNTGGSGDVGFLLGQLDPTLVQSIEVLRGPRATIYGANTTAGVIDFSTSDPGHAEVNLSVEGGSLDWRKVRIGVQNRSSLGDGTLSYSLNGSYVDSDGLNAHEYTKNGTLVGRATWQNSSLEVGGSFYLTDNKFQSAPVVESIADAPPPYFAVQIPDPSNVDKTRAGIVSLWFQQQLTDHLSQKLTVGGAAQDFRLDEKALPDDGLLGTYAAPYDGWTDPNTFQTYGAGDTIPVYQNPFTYRTINNNYQADYILRYRTDFISAVAGATYLGQHYNESENFDGFLSGSSESDATRSVYVDASLNWLNNTLHTSIGARLDSYTTWRSKGTYSIGAAYDVIPALTVYANYGTSFTRPTLSQLYDAIYGNVGVTPEDASTIEAGIRGRQFDGALTESVTYWHSYVDNVIIFDFNLPNPRIVNGSPFGEYNNAAAERSRGVEAEVAWQIVPHLKLAGNYTYTDAQVTDTAGIWQPAIENARNMGNAGLFYTSSIFDLGTNLYLTARRLRYADDFYAPGYARLDLSGRYHVTRQIDVYGRVQNALDHHIIETLGYRNPGVYFIAGATLRFF
jgi:vitamin B12 transporter